MAWKVHKAYSNVADNEKIFQGDSCFIMLGALFKYKLFCTKLYHLIVTTESTFDRNHALIEFYGFENKSLYL